MNCSIPGRADVSLNAVTVSCWFVLSFLVPSSEFLVSQIYRRTRKDKKRMMKIVLWRTLLKARNVKIKAADRKIPPWELCTLFLLFVFPCSTERERERECIRMLVDVAAADTYKEKCCNLLDWYLQSHLNEVHNCEINSLTLPLCVCVCERERERKRACARVRNLSLSIARWFTGFLCGFSLRLTFFQNA
jgi:hypothetical protein